MDCLRVKCRDAHGHVLRPAVGGAAVSDPLTFWRDYCLTGGDVNGLALGLHAQSAGENERILVEFRDLARLAPTRREGSSVTSTAPRWFTSSAESRESANAPSPSWALGIGQGEHQRKVY